MYDQGEVLGRLLFGSDSTNGDDFFTGWMMRGGPRVIVTIQVLNTTPTGDITSLTVQVETKNLDEADSQAVDVGSAETISLANDVTTFDVGQMIDDSGGDVIKQLMRLKFNLKPTGGAEKPVLANIRIISITWVQD